MKNKLIESNKEKLFKAFEHYESTVLVLPNFDSTIPYTSDELVIFDALTSRFVRLYETVIQLFRSVDSVQSIHISESFGDLIANMVKLNIIANEELWFEMRMIRNKISHDYLPTELEKMISLITNEFYLEFNHIKQTMVK